MNNINAITQMLLSKSQAVADRIAEQGRAQAQKIVETAVANGKAEQPRILAQYQARARDVQNSNQVREKMELERSLLAVRQDLVDDVVSRVYNRFIAQSTAQWVEMLKLLLEDAVLQAGGEKPEIIVAPSLLDAAKASIGQAYTLKAGSMRQGFLFSFARYDLNYEPERIFAGSREMFETLAASYLFDGDADETS